MRYLLLLLMVPMFAVAQTKVIELNDGRRFQGTIEFAGPDVVITTTAGKKVLAPTSALKSVRNTTATAPAARSAPNRTPTPQLFPGTTGQTAQIKGIQASIMSNPELLGAIMALADDPKLMATIQDPTLLKLLMSGDAKAIERHPGFKKIANDPRIRTIMRQVKKSMNQRR